MISQPVFTVSDFIAACNQVLEVAIGTVTIEGELANFKISKNKWIFFDLKDEFSSLRFFGTVYNLPGPLEEGMKLSVTGTASLHHKFGFSISIKNIKLAGTGTIKKAFKLLEEKLKTEGLFDQSRKRLLPKAPQSIGVISSSESAGFADFIKIMNERWGGVQVKLYDVLVQGIDAPAQIIEAVEYFNRYEPDIEVLVLIRGGGSADDLQAFNNESVVRAVAGSRLPTLVAIGHETDVSLAELVADLRASTPSNASQLLFLDRNSELGRLTEARQVMQRVMKSKFKLARYGLLNIKDELRVTLNTKLTNIRNDLLQRKSRIELLSPSAVLKRGYVFIKQNNKIVKKSTNLDTSIGAEIVFFDNKVNVNFKN